jgi:hypothetical protein
MSTKRGTDHAITRTRGRVSIPPRAWEAYTLWQQGLTPKVLATRYGVSTKAVHQWIKAIETAAVDGKR